MSITELVGINGDMTQDEIKKAFRKAMMTNHPDRGGSHENMVIITQAWEQYKRTGNRTPYTTTTNNTTNSTNTNTTPPNNKRMDYYMHRKAYYNTLLIKHDGVINRGMARIREELDTLEQELGI